MPVHYDLTVTPDIERERFSGEVVIHVTVQRPTTSIVLNSAEIAYREAAVVARGERQTAKVDLDEANEQATLTFAKALPIGPAEIRLAYDGILNRQLRGFYLGVADGKKHLASQMEATDARRAFPSFDEPDLKATFQITVVAEQAHAVISNSPVESESPAPVAGKRIVRFEPTPRLSTYHIALVVGDFACISDSFQGMPLRICAAPSRVELGHFAMKVTKDALAWFNRYFEIPYPFAKLDQIALTDFQAGAMENPGAITYRETVLLVDEASAPLQRRRASAETIAHEIAHIWFGDLVTMRWWDDIWLNEGFASWMGDRAIESIRPAWIPASTNSKVAGGPMASDVLAATRPIRKSAETPAEIDQLFDGIAYGKTQAILRMIEAYVGDEKFRDGINLYIRRNAWGNASSGDFTGAIDDATTGVVSEIVSSYVSQPGVPLVRVKSRCEGEETVVDLEQSRFLLRGTRTADIEQQLWSIPVCFTGASCVILRERNQSFRLPGCHASLFPNAEGHGYYLTSMEPSAYSTLTTDRAALSPAERLTLMRDQWYLVQAGLRPLGDYLDMAAQFQGDQAVAEQILATLAYATRQMATADEQPRLQALLRRQSEPLLRDLGWSPRADDTLEQRGLRTTVINLLGDEVADTATRRRATELTRRWLRDRSALAPEVVVEVTRVGVIGGDKRLYDAILAGYRTSNDPTLKARFLGLLSAFRDPALLQRTLGLTLTDTIRSQDMAGVLGGVVANPAGGELAWAFINENWAALEKKIPQGHVGRVISSMASAAPCSDTWAARVRQLTTEHDLPHASRAARTALERISNCVALRASQRASLNEWLQRQR